jgi:hypothetical protein
LAKRVKNRMVQRANEFMGAAGAVLPSNLSSRCEYIWYHSALWLCGYLLRWRETRTIFHQHYLLSPAKR